MSLQVVAGRRWARWGAEKDAQLIAVFSVPCSSALTRSQWFGRVARPAPT